MIAKEGHVRHLHLQFVAVDAGRWRQLHPFRADGQHHFVPHRVGFHREGVDVLLAHGHHAGVALHRRDAAGQQVVVADEGGHEGAHGLLVQHLRRGHLLDAAGVEHRHAIGHRHRFLLIVGDVDDGDAQLALDAPDLELHLLAQAAIERPQRLVHQHQIGLEHQRPGDGHALLLAAGELARAPPLVAFQPHQRQRPRHALGDLAGAEVPRFERERKVLAHRHVREQGVVLEHHADVALARRHVLHRLAVDADGAAAGRLEAGQHHEAGGLAGAGGAEQRQELAFAHVQLQIAHHQRGAVVALVHAVELDVGARVAHRGRLLGWCIRHSLPLHPHQARLMRQPRRAAAATPPPPSAPARR